MARAYYAIFHAACALLAHSGRRVRSHEGVRAFVNEHFVRPGTLDPEHARALRQTVSDRNDADYDTSATFAEDDSRADIARAEAFLAAVEAIVTRVFAP